MEIKYLDLGKVTAMYSEEIHEAVRKVLDSGWYLQGKAVNDFEQAYSKYIGTNHCVSCANGLDALTLILRAYKEMGVLSEGDEVIVPANTYIATILSITENGLIPVLVEPDADTLQIDGSLLETSITERTKAVMIVHLYGRCAYTDRIGEICRRYRLLLIEDNAQAHGCRFNGRLTGSLGNAAAHSFYPGKNLGALGDAGAITTSDKELAETVRTIANYGSSRKYVFDYIGRNSRMDEIQAAVLSVKLSHLDIDNERRRRIAGIYNSLIMNDVIRIPACNKKHTVVHIYPVLSKCRDELQAYLADNGVHTMIHYPIPPHHQRCYSGCRRLVLPETGLPVTEMIHRCELSLPCNQTITDEEVNRIVCLVNDFQVD